MQDNKYAEELTREKGKGVPLPKDWEYVGLVLPFLKVFSKTSICIFGASHITCNGFMKEVLALIKRLFSILSRVTQLLS